jgi:arsenate reductase
LREVVAMLGTGARGILRDKESVYGELGLSKASEEQLLSAMNEHPILIERPLAIVGERAVVGRPPENVLALVRG